MNLIASRANWSFLFWLRLTSLLPELPKMLDYNVCSWDQGSGAGRRNRTWSHDLSGSLSGLGFIKHCDTFISVNPEYFILDRATQRHSYWGHECSASVPVCQCLCYSSCYKYKCNQFSSCRHVTRSLARVQTSWTRVAACHVLPPRRRWMVGSHFLPEIYY